MRPTPWFDRTFPTLTDPGLLPGLIERLAGTAVRLDELRVAYDEKQWKQRTTDQWSQQEHLGHLLNLEPLWLARMHDILTEKEYLTTADLTNTATFAARYNEQNTDDLLAQFDAARDLLVELLVDVDASDCTQSALHPRLKTPMTLLDLAYFVAEHDDHHLATIRQLGRPPTLS